MLTATARLASRRLATGLQSRSVALAPFKRYKSTNVPVTAETQKLTQQAPNRAATWSETQRPLSDAVRDPRFVQVDFDGQPRPMAAIELISEEPIREIEGRLACCDGGGGALGHPRVWINLDDGKPQDCGYCGLRFKKSPHHH